MFLLHLDSLLMHEISANECNVKTLNVYNNSVNNLVNAFALNLTVLHTESVGLQSWYKSLPASTYFLTSLQFSLLSKIPHFCLEIFVPSLE